MAKAETAKPSANPSAAATDKTPALTPAQRRLTEEKAFSPRWYGVTFGVSFTAFWILLIYYNGVSQWYIAAPFWVALSLSGGLAIWSGLGLAQRAQASYQVRQAARGKATKRPSAASEDQEVVYRENIIVRLFKFVGRLIMLLLLFVWNTLLRIVYVIEVTILRTIILGYDIFYYVTYAAWAVAFWAVTLSLRIVRWALRVAWKILRLPTRLPLARYLWDKKLMPKIMGKWNARMAALKDRQAKKRETRLRLAAARGLDPAKWEADQKDRHHFPFPHPHDARKGLRTRIDERQKLDFNRRDRWAAYRQNRPIPPKITSERRKRRLEEKEKEKAERKAKGDKGKPAKKGRGGKDAGPSATPDKEPAPDEKGAEAKKAKGGKASPADR